MTIVFEEINARLRRLDEITLLEVLEISSESIVERYQDIIEDRIDELAQEFEDEEEETDE